MAFKLNKNETERRAILVKDITDAFSKLEDAISVYNDEVGKLRAPVEQTLADYNEVVEAARGFCEDVASERQGQFDDRSERWQEGEKGQAAQQWIGEWEGIDLGEIEIEFPSDLEAPDVSHADDLEALPEESSE